LAISQALLLLTLANGTPVIAKRLVPTWYPGPVDGGVRLFDGQPLFGPSKTVRGIALSVLVTSVCAPIVGLEWRIGFLMGSVAMAGDLFSSFVKRRIRLPASSRAVGVDQIPESLFPLLACRDLLSLTLMDLVLIVGMFCVGEIFLSRPLYKLHIRDRPY
jgi:CDP-2,3-bis-(O-geranylgeranyl)-sn-glycerol synthase